MLKVEKISKKFGHFQAISNLSFEVKVGDVMGFLGPNGAGKTT
jgi:ABC-2 type transport system ATP-binding protein